MGGKASAPAAPDYLGAANTQAAASKELTNIQNFANRPVINTPFGSQSWGTQSVTDPASGQAVTQWTQNNTLAPGLQDALNDQISIQGGRSDLANSFMGRVANEYSQPFDYQNLPQMTSANAPATLQTGVKDYSGGLTTGFNFGGPQTSLNTADNPALPQFDSSYRDTVANQLMQKMQPVHDYQQRQLETKLSNMGFRPGTEGYDRELNNMAQRQSAERYNALDTAGSEAQRLYNMQMGTAQQAFNQDLQGGQFGNAAQQQNFNQNLGAAQFQNQALGQGSALDLANMNAQNNAISQQYGLNQQYANAQNQLRQQAIAEQAQRRGMSLNEMNALLSGQQVSMPQMPSFVAAQQSQTPNILGATQSAYDAQLGAANAQNAAFGNLLGAGAQLGSAAFMFSDRRLKSNIKRVGTHAIGVGIYDYTMMGMPQRGVIAQEVEAVRPDLVKRHASGYLMVNYGGL
jgi:hypothetical protein